LKKLLDPDSTYSSLTARLEIHGARVGRALEDEVFAFEVPESAHRVRRFVTPVGRPPEHIGERIGPFRFVDMEGKSVDRESLGADKVLVIDFWFTGLPACENDLQALDKLYARYKDDERVAFLAVSIDPP